MLIVYQQYKLKYQSNFFLIFQYLWDLEGVPDNMSTIGKLETTGDTTRLNGVFL